MVQSKIYEVIDEVNDLEKKMADYVERGEFNDQLVAKWVLDTVKIIGRLGKAIEEVEDRLDLLEEETENKKF
ncbi:MAG: hypothetical protein QMD61_02880 [Methanobacterium sp.]|nr:hypothetical protein [Methanobacterium sp.]